MKSMASRNTDERGSVIVLAAVGIVVSVIAAALAVDLGRLASDKRDDQKVADLAALDASRDLTTACTRANASAMRNGLPANSLSCSPAAPADPTKDVIVGRLASGVFTPDATGDAVQVKVTSPFKAAFPFVVGPSKTSGTAVAGASSEAAFSVGSSAATFDSNRSVLDPLMEGWLGITHAQMSAVSYNGLAGASVTLRALQTQLASLGYTVGTPSQLLAADVKVLDLLKATSSALSGPGNATAKAEVDKLIATSISSTLKVKLGDLVNLAAPGSSSALDATLNVFHLVTGAAQVANGTNFVATGLCVSVVLLSVCTKLKVIERAQVAEGPVGTKAHNSQVVLQLGIPVTGVGIVNVEVKAADAEVLLNAINCSSSPSITLGVTTSAATIGGLVDLGTNVLGQPLGTVTLAGNLVAGASVPDQTFTYTAQFSPPVGSATARQVGASNLDLTPASLSATASNPLLSAATALLIQTTVNTVLTAIGPILDPLLQPTLQGLGLEVAAADLNALDIFPPPPACGKPHLLK